MPGSKLRRMKFCKPTLSEKRHRTYGPKTYGERALRVASLAALGALFAAGACVRRADPGFDIVPVPSSAYLAVTYPEGGVVPDGGREAGAAAVSSKCEPPPEDDFEPSDDVPECPAENKVGWSLDPRATARHRDRDEDVCCYKRGVVRIPEID